LKIRFLMHDLFGPGGGVLKVVLGLAGDLAQRHDVELVSAVRFREEATHRLPEGVRVRTLADLRPRVQPRGPAGALRRWARQQPSRVVPRDDPRFSQHNRYTDLRLARYLWSVRGGVLIGMQPVMNVAIARLARPSTVRIAQEHRPFVSRNAGLREAAVQYYPRLDMFLTLTERDAQRYRTELGDGVPVRAIPNGTPVYTGTPSDHSSKVVVAAGRLERSKGYDRLIEAWAGVARRHPDWELRIFGEGRDRDALQEQIDKLGLAGSARLMGYSAHLAEDMAAASLFVLSSRAEGYPMVLLEAMSCGLPVVSFDCPTGPREIITPDSDGLLVPNGDVEGLADAVSRLIGLGEGRREMGRAALQTAWQRDQAAITARWEELCSELLAAKGRGRGGGGR
jgi:glycosyltransferase involved in cell wall biosynthesis